MDPDERADHRRDVVDERHRTAQIEQVKQSIQPVIQAAQSGAFGIGPTAGQALLNAIHHCQDGLNDSRHLVGQIQQDTKLGTSPDALVMTTFNKEVAAGGSNSAATALEGLREILAQAEMAITEAMKHYRGADAAGAAGINRAGT